MERAVAFPNGLPPTIETVHPTQIYEALIMLVVFLYLWKIRKDIYKTGYIFSLYLILAGSERFIIEFLRNTTRSSVPNLSIAQVMAAIVILFGLYKLFRLKSV